MNSKTVNFNKMSTKIHWAFSWSFYVLYTSTHQYAFIVWCSFKAQGQLHLTFAEKCLLCCRQ